MNTLLDTLDYFGFIFLELVVLFLSISTAISLILQYIPREKFGRYLSGRAGYFMAALLGSITPFCACSTIPLTLGLLNAGVSIGPVLTFVLVSPLLNPIIVGMVWSLMGWKACLIYFFACFGSAMAGGWLMKIFHAERYVRKLAEPETSCCSGESSGPAVPAAFRGKLKKAFFDAYGDLQRVLIYLIVGTAIGATIYGYIPQEWIVSLAAVHPGGKCDSNRTGTGAERDEPRRRDRPDHRRRGHGDSGDVDAAEHLQSANRRGDRRLDFLHRGDRRLSV